MRARVVERREDGRAAGALDDVAPPGGEDGVEVREAELLLVADLLLLELRGLALRGRLGLARLREPVWKSNLQHDFNVRVCDSFDASSSALLRELDESNRSVQKSAKTTSICPS